MVSPSKITDNGGTRETAEGRQNSVPYCGVEKRAGRDRRKGLDRRRGLGRRRGSPNQKINVNENDIAIERRDIFR